MLELDTYRIREGDFVVFRVIVRKGDRMLLLSQVVQVIEGDPPDIRIEYVQVIDGDSPDIRIE